jgi:hypothetical protein
MVPTFCAEELAFGSARHGDGDLPLIGVGGGDPKRESWSWSPSWSTGMFIDISIYVELRRDGVN